jgi:hypothetical protein
MSEITKVIGATAAVLSAAVALLTYLDSKPLREAERMHTPTAFPAGVPHAPVSHETLTQRSECGDVAANAICVEVESKPTPGTVPCSASSPLGAICIEVETAKAQVK